MCVCVCVYVCVRQRSVKRLFTQKHLHRVQGIEALAVVRFGVTDEGSQRVKGLLRIDQGLRRRRPTLWPSPHTSTTNWLALVHPSHLMAIRGGDVAITTWMKLYGRTWNGNNWKKRMTWRRSTWTGGTSSIVANGGSCCSRLYSLSIIQAQTGGRAGGEGEGAVLAASRWNQVSVKKEKILQYLLFFL